ncbi:hypothetical protein EYF80_061951 [Liparis tanakae]|uniref:Uncharacterized protein n=1 Tax=Liparis tanakae TaxID=230148 RepID=A0A4Z2EGW6_9TELE|nr:hypothetical protein EYF80_061951 [Liparis tanakae]
MSRVCDVILLQTKPTTVQQLENIDKVTPGGHVPLPHSVSGRHL